MSIQSRTYPAFPIPAVGAVILEQEHVLLVQRGQPPSEGQWTVPGGVVEIGESPDEAIIREVHEECGIEVQVVGILDVVNRIVRDDVDAVKYHYVIIDYLACCRDPRPGQRLPEYVVRAGTDVRDARWIPFQELSTYDVTEGLRPIIQAGMSMQGPEWKKS